MSALDLYLGRASTIWKPFQCYGINNEQLNEVERFFGLFAHTYVNGYNYLNEISLEELQLIVDQYDSNIAVLENEYQILLVDIMAKRYIANVDAIIHADKMASKRYNIETEQNIWDSRENALEADREAINTLRLQLDIAINKANSRKTILEAQIQEEKISQEYVNIDIAKMQLENANKDLEILRVGIRAAEIQLQIVDASVDLANVKVQEANIAGDIARLKAETVRQELVENEAAVDLAQNGVIEYEYDTMIGVEDNPGWKVKAIEKRQQLVRDEITANGNDTRSNINLKEIENIKVTGINSEEDTRSTFRNLQTTIAHDSNIEDLNYRTYFDPETLEHTKNVYTLETGELLNTKKQSYGAKVDAEEVHKLAVIRAAEILANANIQSKLVHTLGKWQ